MKHPLPPLLERQLRNIPNRGRRKRMAKEIHRMLRHGNTVSLSARYSDMLEARRAEGERIPNRAERRQ